MANKTTNKKKSSSSSSSSYNNTLVKIQKLANTSAKSIQDSINATNKEQMTFNSAEAQKARDWQENMSKSAHQMEVEDLKKAGLNPVLSANSGAQSYTTSSASTQNESGASARAAIMSEQMGALSNLESARLNTEAQLKASKQQAEATRFAATQSAMAQKYAAEQSYKSTVYRANTDAQIAEKNRKNERWIVKNQNASTWAAFLDKYLRNTGVGPSASKAIKNALSSGIGQNMRNNPKKFFKNSGKITSTNFKMTNRTKQLAESYLSNMNCAITNANKRRWVRAVLFGDKSAAKALCGQRLQNYTMKPVQRW